MKKIFLLIAILLSINLIKSQNQNTIIKDNISLIENHLKQWKNKVDTIEYIQNLNEDWTKTTTSIINKTSKLFLIKYSIDSINLDLNCIIIDDSIIYFEKINYLIFVKLGQFNEFTLSKENFLKKIYNENIGIDSITFENNYYGYYFDSWYLQRRTDFEMNFEIIEKDISTTDIQKKGEVFIEANEIFSIVMNRIDLVLVFSSHPNDMPLKRPVKRTIIYDPETNKIHSYSIKGEYHSIFYDDFSR